MDGFRGDAAVQLRQCHIHLLLVSSQPGRPHVVWSCHAPPPCCLLRALQGWHQLRSAGWGQEAGSRLHPCHWVALSSPSGTQ